MARIKPGVPTVKEIREGESEYRYISGTGLVLYTRYNNRLYSTKMHEAPTPPIMDKKLEVAIGDRVSSSVDEGDFIKADGSVTFTGNQSHGGNDITGVNDLTVSDDVTIGDDLDVDGHTTLDQVTVNTADGAFAVSGANPISLTTTGTNDVNITSGQTLDVGIGVDYELDVTRTCDWNTATVDWDNSNTFDLTSVGNITIETSAATTDKKILIQNTNNHASDFTGIHIKTSSQGAGSSYNGILIECDNIAGKGGTAGVDIRSENGIRIRSENDNSGGTTTILMRATGPIDIGVGSSLTPHTTNNRVKIHGSNGIEFATLYRADGDAAIDTTDATWDKIDTLHLVRTMTYKANDTALSQSSALTIVTAANDDNLLSTVWMVTVYWKHSATKKNLQVYWVYFTSASSVNIVKVVEDLNASTTAGVLSWTSGGGIVWTNEDTQDARVHASALKIQGSGDF